jgi:hypothetical protein
MNFLELHFGQIDLRRYNYYHDFKIFFYSFLVFLTGRDTFQRLISCFQLDYLETVKNLGDFEIFILINKFFNSCLNLLFFEIQT